MPLSAIGGAPILNSAKCIRTMRKGCANRPFYHIVVIGVSNVGVSVLLVNLVVEFFRPNYYDISYYSLLCITTSVTAACLQFVVKLSQNNVQCDPKRTGRK